MVEKMEAAGIFEEDMQDTQLDNLAEYFETLPAEVAMKLWKVVATSSTADKKNNIVRFHSRIRETLTEMLSD